MGKSLSLDAIKQQFNLPQNATVAEVKQVAEANNIVIDFSKNKPNEAPELNNPSGSILGGDTSQTTGTKSSFGLKNTGFNGGSLFDTSASSGLQNNNSVFGFGSGNGNLSDGFTLNKPAFENQALSNFGASGMTKGLKGYNEDTTNKFKLETPKFGFGSGFKLNGFNNFLSSSISSYDGTNKIKFVDDDSENVVKLEYSEDGTKVTKTFIDGSKKTFDVPEDKQAQRKEFGGALSTEFITVDGKPVARMTLADGTVQDRPVLKGEHGFVKDGKSIDEDLVATLGQDRVAEMQEKGASAKQEIATIDESLEKLSDENIAEIEKTDPKRAKELKKERAGLLNDKRKIKQRINKEEEALAAEYIKKVYKECGGDTEKIKARIGSLIKNSDMNTEASQQMVRILGRFHDKYGNLTQDEMAGILAGVMDPSRENGVDNAAAMAETSTMMTGKSGKAVRGALVGAAKQTGTEKVVAETMVQNIGNAVDAETGKVDTEVAQDIGRNVIDLTGKDGAIDLAEQLQKEDSDDLKVAGNTPIDEYAAKTGDEEVMQASVDVITSIDDADKQVQANENAHKTYEEMGASDEIKQARAEIMGQNLYKFSEDARARIDELERQNDINNAYSTAAQEAKTKYEAQQKSETKTNKTETKTETKETTSSNSSNNSSKTTTTRVADSSVVIKNIVSNKNLNLIEKTKKLKELGTKDQQVAIKQLIEKATIPEVKGYILSGFKSEVFSYLLDNYSPDKKEILDSVKYLMTTSEVDKYNKVLKAEEEKENAQAVQNKNVNFFKM